MALDVTSFHFTPESLAGRASKDLSSMGVTSFRLAEAEKPEVLISACTFLQSQISINPYESTGHSFAMPYLPVFTIDVVLRGRLEKTVKDVPIALSSEETALCPPSSIDVALEPDPEVGRATGISCFIPVAAANGLMKANGLTLSEQPAMMIGAVANDAVRSFRELMAYAHHEFIVRKIDRLPSGRARLADALVSDHAVELFQSVGFAVPSDETQTASLRSVIRCEEVMRARYHEPLTIAQIASEIGTSVRSLQRALRAHKGISPSLLLSTVRLEAARARLLEGRSGDTVTSVAYECGIYHLGRFATRYRALFAEPPQATLRQAKGRTGPSA